MSNVSGLQQLGTTALQATARSGAVATGAAKQGEVLLSADQTRLSSAGSALAAALGTSDVRTEKVQALQQAIAAGTYSVPAGAVADKVISSLLGR